MLIVEGMPGSGCTRRLGAVLARTPQATVFPALPSPSGNGGETVVRAELAEDYRRSDIAEYLPGPVLADGCHLGTLARAYVRARLCLEWDTFRRALGMTAPLDVHHRDDEVLILHSSPEAAFHRRHGRTARPGDGEFAALQAYAQFVDALDQWVTPGPKWRHFDAADPAVDQLLAARMPDRAPAGMAGGAPDLVCGHEGCGRPRSPVLARGGARIQLWSRGLHRHRPGNSLRCLRSAHDVMTSGDDDAHYSEHARQRQPPAPRTAGLRA